MGPVIPFASLSPVEHPIPKGDGVGRSSRGGLCVSPRQAGPNVGSVHVTPGDERSCLEVSRFTVITVGSTVSFTTSLFVAGGLFETTINPSGVFRDTRLTKDRSEEDRR